MRGLQFRVALALREMFAIQRLQEVAGALFGRTFPIRGGMTSACEQVGDGRLVLRGFDDRALMHRGQKIRRPN